MSWILDDQGKKIIVFPVGEGVVDGVVLFGSSSEVVFGVVFVSKVVFVLVCSNEVLIGSVCSGVVLVVFGILDVEGVGELAGGVLVKVVVLLLEGVLL
uniref:Transmembrane protein n=1 Tax=Tanacetum cinerariifolium TaxID=118510 RepID=A0A699GT87_TANCI|nr:hypothetical protein [Tanacetum cinerariifolium]